MKRIFSPLARSLALLALVGAVHLQAATATLPTPIDTNTNGTIDSDEIQAVIDAGNGVVFLPANQSYTIDATLIIDGRNGVSLVGEGPATLLSITSDIEAVVITNGTGCGLRHLKLTGPGGHTQNAIRISGGNEHFVEDVTIENTYRGIELVNGIGPVLVDVAMTGLTGDYGIKIDAATGKVDAAQLHGITGSASASSVEWLLFGRIDGVELQTASFSGGKRGIRCIGSIGPKYVYTNQVTIANCTHEGILVESGSDLLINATTINQTGASGFSIGAAFVGGAVLTDLNVSGAAGHGLQIDGGRDIGILEPVLSATGSALPSGTGAGIYIATDCSYVSITDGAVAGQHYGIFYAGTETQSDSQDVKIKDVYTADNPVPFAPSNLDEAPAIPTVFVVDNADATAVTRTGTWTASTAVAGYYGTNFLHDGNTGAAGAKSVRFSPDLPLAASYEVYLRWTATPNRANNVPVDINHAGGTTTVFVNQRVDNGTWVLLGTFTFNPGTSGNVLIRNTGANGFVIADAVQFVRQVTSTAIALGNLTQVYDRTPKAATATTTPAGVVVGLTYDGQTTHPVDAGSYVVVATTADPNYAGSATGTLTITKAAATVTLINLEQAHDGSPQPVTVTTSPAGLPVTVTYNGSASAPSAVGSHPVFAAVTESNYDGQATGTLVIRDTTPPIIQSLVASPATLWPPNHQMVPVTVTATVTDAVDAAPIVRITSVTSNEPVNGAGDDNTSPDWEITGALTLQLRAERAGSGSGRVYTITVEAHDDSDNVSVQTVAVTVPHNH